MRKRLRHWLFEARGKKCRFCCYSAITGTYAKKMHKKKEAGSIYTPGSKYEKEKVLFAITLALYR